MRIALKIIPASELANLPDGNWQTVSLMHHNSHVWVDQGTTRQIYGPIEDLAKVCAASQFARADGLRHAIPSHAAAGLSHQCQPVLAIQRDLAQRFGQRYRGLVWPPPADPLFRRMARNRSTCA